jgi:hypothetical protein
MSMMTLRSHSPITVCWCIFAFAAVAVGVSLIVLGPSMAPLKRGSVEHFWKCACGVDLASDKDTSVGDAYLVDDKWAAYEISNLHGSKIYFVSADDAISRFDAVVTLLRAAKQRGEESKFVEGLVAWDHSVERPRTAQSLLDEIKAASRKAYAAKDIDLLVYSITSEQQFWQRWRRADWYWANFAFEWAGLSGLALFAVWTGIRRKSPLRLALHAALLPLLFLLPTYLGYATFSFTSAGPSGGIVYPYLLWWARGGSVNSFDRWLLERLPQVLEPISTPIGSPMALTGMGLPGPTSALIAGIVVGVVVICISLACRTWSRLRAGRQIDF